MQKNSQLGVNMEKATKKWSSLCEKLNVSPERRNDIIEYAEMHSQLIQSGMVKENAMYANPANTAGMGAVNFPGLTGQPGLPGTAGSGDLGQTMLPGAVKIAAHTIGLELAPMINVNANRVDLLYFDWEYDNNNGFDSDERASTFKFRPDVDADFDSLVSFLRAQMVANGVTEGRGTISKPLYFHLSDGGTALDTEVGAAYDATVAPTGDKSGWVQFKGFSRLDGLPMFRIYTQSNSASSGAWAFDSAKNTLPATGALTTLLSGATIDAPADGLAASGHDVETVGTGNIMMVSTAEDFIDDFTSSKKQDQLNRGEWDVDQAGKVGPRSFTKSVEIGVTHISAALRLSEIGDWKRMYGIDVIEKTKERLINEMSQKMSNDIVNKVKEMALKNRTQAPSAPTGLATGLATGGITDGTIYDMSVSAIASSLGGENTQSIARKLWGKITQASYFVSTDGRIGGIDYIVTSGTVAGVLKQVERYTHNPMDSKLAANGQIQPAGSIDGIKLYVDPYMSPADLTVFMGRVGTKEDPGLKVLAYMLAESVEVVSEKNMAPHLYMYSRYNITEFGHFPEKQYFALKVEDVNGLLY